MKRESFIETLNQIIFWLEEMTRPKILFTLLILVLLNATKAQMGNIFLSEMEKILQVLPDMLALILILVMNNQEEMTSKQLDMSFFTFLEAHFLGKVFQEDQRLKSMLTSRRRRRKQQSKSWVVISLMSSKSLCTTVVALVLPKTLTTDTLSLYLKGVWRDMVSILVIQTSSGTRIA